MKIRVTRTFQYEPNMSDFPEGATAEDVIEIDRKSYEDGILELLDLNDNPFTKWEVIG